jgi:hypothetical protein
MKRALLFKLLSILVVLSLADLLTSCVEPFAFKGVSTAPNYLVVDGFIDTGKDSAFVVLSHTIPLSANEPPMPEFGAAVTLSDDQGKIYNLVESFAGTYTISHAGFELDREYKLTIQTGDEKRYSTVPIRLINTPPIDSLTWQFDDGEIDILVNSHGSAGDSKYYRWKVSEAWDYTAPYLAIYRIINHEVVEQTVEESWYRCWAQNSPSTIIIGSTSMLNENTVRNLKVMSIPPRSIRLVRKYSINVTQQALSEEAYSYWLSLKKTTESVGGLFDPLPSEVRGNITCETNPEERVIGFFSGGNISSKRIYIKSTELPLNYDRFRFPYCNLDTLDIEDVPQQPDRSLIFPVYSPPAAGPPSVIAYVFSSTDCTDCRAYGGTTTRPIFWQE